MPDQQTEAAGQVATSLLMAGVSLESDFDLRKSLYRIDKQVCAELETLQCLTQPLVRPAIDAFWQDASAVPRRKELFAENRDRIRECEIAHFEILLSGKFEHQYLASCTKTAETEFVIGLDIAARVCAGNILFEKCVGAFSRAERFRSHRVSRYAAVLAKALAFDLGNAILLHTEAAALSRSRRHRLIEDEIANFAPTIRAVVDAIKDASVSLAESSATMQRATTITHRLMASVSRASQETSNGVSLTAAAAGQISAAIREIGSNAHASLEKAQAAMRETDAAQNLIVDLAESVKRIGSVVDIISRIAAQTNLLALNASIEASRGGAGRKGFAVVASEIKALAAQTSQATQDISRQILAIREGTNRSVKEMSSITATMNDVCTAAHSIASALEQQGLATKDILNHAELLTRTKAAETEEIKSVEDATKQGASAADDIHNWTKELSSRSADLASKVEGFFARVRTI